MGGQVARRQGAEAQVAAGRMEQAADGLSQGDDNLNGQQDAENLAGDVGGTGRRRSARCRSDLA
jgi:hypothetical protein